MFLAPSDGELFWHHLFVLGFFRRRRHVISRSTAARMKAVSLTRRSQQVMCLLCGYAISGTGTSAYGCPKNSN
jgi:hypothetical protein